MIADVRYPCNCYDTCGEVLDVEFYAGHVAFVWRTPIKSQEYIHINREQVKDMRRKLKLWLNETKGKELA